MTMMLPNLPRFRRSFQCLTILLYGALLYGSSGCSAENQLETVEKENVSNFWVGEAIVGEGNEIALINLVIGEKTGPVGVAFTTGIASQRYGHPSLLADFQSNMAVKPSTLLVSRVTLTGEK